MSVLDDLPLEVLLAMQEAMADPTAAGQERARKRAADAGLHLFCAARPADPHESTEPIPMEEAPPGVEALTLRFDR